jgi:hypothetical protein
MVRRLGQVHEEGATCDNGRCAGAAVRFAGLDADQAAIPARAATHSTYKAKAPAKRARCETWLTFRSRIASIKRVAPMSS